MFRSALLGLGLVALAGCRAEPAPADPEAAREAVRRALDAWKKGEPLDGYRQANPGLIVADRQWQQGTRLLDYDLGPEPVPAGHDLQFVASLSLQDPAGRTVRTKAAYVVSTSPKLVVLRSEGGG